MKINSWKNEKEKRMKRKDQSLCELSDSFERRNTQFVGLQKRLENAKKDKELI
jgi:hypothetical protein